MRERLLRATLAAALSLVPAGSPAAAHVIVAPAESQAGALQRYGIVVPSEKTVPTVRVEVQFPRLLRVEALEATPGWQVSVQRESGGRIVSAVWQGAEIGLNEFVEFGVLARNPDQSTQLSWTLIQTYSDASEVQWIGPPSAEFPAAVTEVTAPLVRIGGAELASVGALLLSAAALCAVLVSRRGRSRLSQAPLGDPARDHRVAQQ